MHILRREKHMAQALSESGVQHSYHICALAHASACSNTCIIKWTKKSQLGDIETEVKIETRNGHF